ncbi:unnamed protein product, partial [Dovyalis caffra]
MEKYVRYMTDRKLTNGSLWPANFLLLNDPVLTESMSPLSRLSDYACRKPLKATDRVHRHHA